MLIAIILIILVVSGYLFLIFPAKTKREDYLRFAKYGYAHRGFHDNEIGPSENTMDAFIAANGYGYGIELDVQLTRDKKVVVFHDSDLARTSSIDQKILDIDYNQLKQIKVYGREEIPLLEDVLAVLDKNLPIVVEIKSEGGREWVNEICRLTYEILRGYDGIYCVESFDPLAVAWFKKADPSIIRGQLSMAATGYKGTTNPFTGFLLHSLLLNLISRPHFIAYQHEDNCLALMILKLLRVMIFRWTIKNQQRHNELLAISDGLIFEGYTPESRW